MTQEHVLTLEETAFVFGMYTRAKRINIGTSIEPVFKIELNQLKYMTDENACMLSCWYDTVPFAGTLPSDWRVTREGFEIKVACSKKGQYFIIDTDNGDVHVLRAGMRSHLGTSAYAFQFHMKHSFALPLFFDNGHWANGKNALQLGLAVPNQTPLNEALLKLFGSIEMVNDWRFSKKLSNVDLYDNDVYNKELEAILKLI